MSLTVTLTNNPILSTDGFMQNIWNILGKENNTCPEVYSVNFGRSKQLSDAKYNEDPTLFVDTTRVGNLVI